MYFHKIKTDFVDPKNITRLQKAGRIHEICLTVQLMNEQEISEPKEVSLYILYRNKILRRAHVTSTIS